MHKLLYWLISSNFLFHCHILGLKFFYTLSFQKRSIAFCLSVLVSQFLMHMLMFCLLLCSSVSSLVITETMQEINNIRTNERLSQILGRKWTDGRMNGHGLRKRRTAFSSRATPRTTDTCYIRSRTAAVHRPKHKICTDFFQVTNLMHTSFIL